MKRRRYYLDNEDFSFSQKLKNSIYGKKIKPFPEAVVLETISGCNARCVFCAQYESRKGLPNGRMSDELFKKIANECVKYEGLLKRFSFAFDNEPLLDDNLIDKVSYVKANCPFVTTNITTNGILLTKDTIETIYAKECVDEINISINSIYQETYEKLTGVKTFAKVMANMDYLSLIHKRHVGKKPVIEINMCLTPEIISEKKVMSRYWHEKGFRSHYIKLDNRNKNTLEYKKQVAKAIPYHKYCRRPFHTMIICWDGIVPICCADYSRSCVLGDVSLSSLYDVWNGELFYKARKELITGKFDIAKLCASCMMST